MAGETQGKGSVLATMAVETQGKGSVLATMAVETQGKGSVSPSDYSHPWLRRSSGRSQGRAAHRTAWRSGRPSTAAPQAKAPVFGRTTAESLSLPDERTVEGSAVTCTSSPSPRTSPHCSHDLQHRKKRRCFREGNALFLNEKACKGYCTKPFRAVLPAVADEAAVGVRAEAADLRALFPERAAPDLTAIRGD